MFIVRSEEIRGLESNGATPLHDGRWCYAISTDVIDGFDTVRFGERFVLIATTKGGFIPLCAYNSKENAEREIETILSSLEENFSVIRLVDDDRDEEDDEDEEDYDEDDDDDE